MIDLVPDTEGAPNLKAEATLKSVLVKTQRIHWVCKRIPRSLGIHGPNFYWLWPKIPIKHLNWKESPPSPLPELSLCCCPRPPQFALCLGPSLLQQKVAQGLQRLCVSSLPTGTLSLGSREAPVRKTTKPPSCCPVPFPNLRSVLCPR